MEKAVVLLSGGLDSTTALAVARARGFACYALTVSYGQRHQVELEAARRVAAHLGAAAHRVLSLDLAALGGSALTSATAAVPKGRPLAEIGGDEAPATYVPARNAVLLSLALAWAEAEGAHHIFLGVNVLDSSGYPDCRPAFVRAFAALANLATRPESGPFHVEAPLLTLDKAEIIRLGVSLGVDYSLTHTCYDPDPEGRACGGCDACQLRRKGFAVAGVADPTRYISAIIRP